MQHVLCMYVCTFMYACMYGYMSMWMHICLYYGHIHVWICVCMCVCVLGLQQIFDSFGYLLKGGGHGKIYSEFIV